jgi:hypothetical protein
MMVYSMGLAAVANDNMDVLVAVLSKPVVIERAERQPLLTSINWSELDGFFKVLEAQKQKYFPASEWLYSECRETLRQLIPLDSEYNYMFDRFEIVRSLVYIGLNLGGRYEGEIGEVWGPPGRFVWKSTSRRLQRDVLGELRTDDETLTRLLGTGFFGSRSENLLLVIDKFRETVGRMAQRCY